LTVHLSDDVAKRLAAEAARRGVSVDVLVSELVAAQLPQMAGSSGMRHLAFAAVGGSGGSSRGGAQADEMLDEGFGRD